MKNILLSTAITLLLSQAAHAGIVEIDLDKLDNLHIMLKQHKEANKVSPRVEQLEQAMQKTQEACHFSMDLYATRKAFFDTRISGCSLAFSKHVEEINKRSTLQEKRDYLIGILKAEHKYTDEDVLAFDLKFREIVGDISKEVVDPTILLDAKKHPLRCVGSQLLGIIPDYSYQSTPNDLEERKEVFKLLKTSGVLITSVEDLASFKYDPAQEVVSFLANHPEVDTLVVGCGHFFSHDSFPYTNMRASFGGCESCKHPTHHKNELTLDLDIGQNPDVIGDGTDVNIWNAIPEGRLARIVDDTWGGIFSNPNADLQTPLYRALKPGGKITFEDYSLDIPMINTTYEKPLDSSC